MLDYWINIFPGMEINPTNIRIWIHERDISNLERVVWEGYGHLLTGQTSSHSKIRKFLEATPKLMVRKEYLFALKPYYTLRDIANVPLFQFERSNDVHYFQNDIKEVHEAAVLGNVDPIVNKEYRQPVYTSKDINGIPAFHKVRSNLVPKYSPMYM